MKLVRFRQQKGIDCLGVQISPESIADLSSVPGLPSTPDMLSLIEMGTPALDALKQAVATAPIIDTTVVEILAPIGRPPKILAVALNYQEHRDEVTAEGARKGQKFLEGFPSIFNKQTTSVNNPYGDVIRPRESEQLDYEGELGIIIGKKCRRVKRDQAHEVIFGYTVVNDFSVRDWQMRGPPHTLTMGKSWDTHCPFGPSIVTADEVADPHNLDMKTFVNGEVRQAGNTSMMMFDCYDLIEYLSTAFTLEPGDLIATGTPRGSSVVTERWLNPGDIVKVEIESLGYIENKIVADTDTD